MEPDADGVPDVVMEGGGAGQLDAEMLGGVETLFDALDERVRFDGALPVARVDAATAGDVRQEAAERPHDASQLDEVVLVALLVPGGVDTGQLDDELEGLVAHAGTKPVTDREGHGSPRSQRQLSVLTVGVLRQPSGQE